LLQSQAVKYGINLLNFGSSATPKHFERWARFAEDNFFDALMISDHVAVTPDVQARYPAPFYDPFTVLSWLAGMTSRIEIGTTVIVLPYRHPLQIARAAANIDQMSNGRLIFGVGVGWAKQEFHALGIPFEQRGAIANECLRAIQLCWAESVASFEGKFFSFTNVYTEPGPLRKPHPPIWVGGASDGAIRRAVRLGDAWHPIRIRIDWLRQNGLPRLQKIAAAEGRKVPALCPRIMLHITKGPMPDDARVAGQGSIAQIREDLDALLELGAEYVVLDTYSGDPRETESLDRHFEMLSELPR
jgi:probable F420-dependent oxidoreductase